MAITYPSNCNTARERTEWLYAVQEILRHIRNLFGYWSQHEISQTQYDNPPLPNVQVALKPIVLTAFAYLKSKYLYEPKLSPEKWIQFLTEDFNPRSDRLTTAICEQRKSLRESVSWLIEIEDI